MAVLITSCGNSGESNSGESNSIKIFSIAEDKQVVFSPGNLQYNAMYNQWRFAENQTDLIGSLNCYILYNDYEGWIDLFGWSTDATYFGVSRSTHNEDYSGSFVDWGKNQIGDDAPNTWRTLTWHEWEYLLESRTNASSLCGNAYVNGVRGLVLLPDNWKCPRGVAFNSGFSEYIGEWQTFTVEQWSKLEVAGAIFLPYAGFRIGLKAEEGAFASYWTATNKNHHYAKGLKDIASTPRSCGLPVRLVKDLQNVMVEDSVSGVTQNTNDGTEKRNVSDASDIKANSYDYVDLGLSVMWATMNVGANCPEDFGDYFAWGETTPQRSKSYNMSTYKWCQEGECDGGCGYSYSQYLTKYCLDSYYGKVDNKKTLELSDDAARANWGGKWRMPTYEEFLELYSQCSWWWVCKNGVYGCEVKSKKNCNSIFLPAAGFYSFDSYFNSNPSGHYWSSDLSNKGSRASILEFSHRQVYACSTEERYQGASVRPVKKLFNRTITITYP